MAINVEEAVEPMVPKLAQAGGPLTAAHDAEFAQQTTALWWRGSATRRSWVWPDPDTAPVVSSATLGSYLDFELGDSSQKCDLALPWHYQAGADGLVLLVTLCAAAANERMSVRATLTGLDAAVTADKNSPAAVARVMPGVPPGLWSRRTQLWRMFVADIRFTGITTDNMTADRRGSIKLAVTFDHRTTPDNLSVLHDARIYSVQAYDVFPRPDPEDEG